MFRNKSVSLDHFSMVPRADIPRSTFKLDSAHKTTFDAGYLVPVYVDEVLPGDTFNMRATMFCRMATPILPIMDNLHLDTFWFFVPNRLVWDNWHRFMGERAPTPTSSIDYTVPQLGSPAGGFAPLSLYDYFGLGTTGQISGGATQTVNALPARAYALIWNEWFRDENLQDEVTVYRDDGPDTSTDYTLLRRGKRHDYFTSALPWVQKGDPVSLPLTGNATIKTNVSELITTGGTAMFVRNTAGTAPVQVGHLGVGVGGRVEYDQSTWSPMPTPGVYPTNLYADLSTATAATINQLRQSFQIQKLLERDARGGTRYTEIIRSHFGVISPDARLQRPEYLGGSSAPIQINPIAQTQATQATITPLATLGAFAHGISRTGFTQSFTEHGYIMCLASVRADLTYQQGLRRMWSRKTRYDFYFPVFAHLGEQPIYNREIYAIGGPAGGQDDGIFGYQERWAEYRYHPSRVTGLFKSTTAGTIDPWHLAQRFTALPTLNSTFIQDTPPVSRVVAVGAAANGQQFLFDSMFECKAARPLPMYSVPGLVDHF